MYSRSSRVKRISNHPLFVRTVIRACLCFTRSTATLSLTSNNLERRAENISVYHTPDERKQDECELVTERDTDADEEPVEKVDSASYHGCRSGSTVEPVSALCSSYHRSISANAALSEALLPSRESSGPS